MSQGYSAKEFEGLTAQQFADRMTAKDNQRILVSNELVEQTAETKRLAKQIQTLADFIMREIPGEPSQDQGAVDTAIRLLRAAYQPKSTPQ